MLQLRRPTALILGLALGLLLLTFLCKLQHYTHLLGPAGQNPAAAPWGVREALQKYIQTDIARKHGSGDLYTVTSKMRLFRDLHKLHLQSPLGSAELALYKDLEAHLFKWALQNVDSVERLNEKVQGRGIVISLGNNYLRLGVHVIKMLRMLDCTLPVEIFYNGESDLKKENIKVLTSMGKDIRLVDISLLYNITELRISSWDLKPFAILSSSFQQVMLVDADAVFLQNPALLFDDPGYIETGTLFFNDRTLYGTMNSDQPEWFGQFLPEPHSPYLKSTRMYNKRSHYEQESGVVLIDKKRCLLGLLAACRFNVLPEREELHKKTHGEKESFWLGFEMVQQPYYFVPTMAGAIGKIDYDKQKDLTQICGKLAHFDRHGELSWFNDGIVDDKKSGESDPFRYEYYGMEGRWENLCLVAPPQKVNGSIKAVLHRIVASFDRSPADMSNPQVGAAMYNLGRYNP